MLFGHWLQILLLLGLALLVFGPKRMVEMGSALGRAVKDFRESTKDISWSSLLSGNEQPAPSHAPEHFAQDDAGSVVEGSVTHNEEHADSRN
ncbi:MAG TPA: twin-arginine translocase TatA/TatE family subunit [Ktedonobacterales bacterium]|jgi:TatA/E family protein of Tat protein translocase|nr:twin-arginine translocase TatA/TatE family subunit [Ktedonobacterales bacterium]